MSLLKISSRRCFAKKVNTLKNMDGVYQIGHPAQLDETAIAVGLNIRCCGVNAIDLEVGNDVMILRNLEHTENAEIRILDRPSKFINPLTGQEELLARYPKNIGFVPLGAKLDNGVPHPFAGTGFIIGQVMGFPLERLNRSDCFAGIPQEKIFYGFEIAQLRYDGKIFVVGDKKICKISEILSGYVFGGGSVGPILPDGDGLMMAYSGCSDYGDGKVYGCGILRWKNKDGQWHASGFDSVYEDKSKFETLNGISGNFIEPTVVRLADGQLLFTAREVGKYPFAPGPQEAERLHLWKSADNGKTWSLCFCMPHFHPLTPMGLDISSDGTPFIIANAYGTTNSKGERLNSIVLREKLLAYPVKKDLSGLESPFVIQDGPVDFGFPPNGSFWRIDLPVGMTVSLADKRLHHLIFYRVLEHKECDSNAMPTDFTGCHVAEVVGGGTPLPVWNF